MVEVTPPGASVRVAGENETDAHAGAPVAVIVTDWGPPETVIVEDPDEPPATDADEGAPDNETPEVNPAETETGVKTANDAGLELPVSAPLHAEKR